MNDLASDSSPFRVIVRRSVAQPAAIVTLVVGMLNFFLRSTEPLHEMTWAVYNYNFVTVLLAPTLAGLAAWDGVRLSYASEALRARAVDLRALTLTWLATSAAVAATYLVGAGAIVVSVKVFGTPGWGEPLTYWTLLPAIGLLSAALAVGLSAGWVTERWVTVGIVPVVTFGTMIFGYSVDATFVRVGGATASLIALQPRLEVGTAQMVLYMAVAGLALVGGTRRLPSRRLAAGFLIGAAVGASTLLSTANGTLEQHTIMVDCRGSDPEVCLAPEYERYRDGVEAAIRPLAHSIAASGVLDLTRLTQDATDNGPGVGFIPMVRSVRDDPATVAIGAISNSILAGCGEIDTPEVLAAQGVFLTWLDMAYEGSMKGATPEATDLVVRALNTIADECGA